MELTSGLKRFIREHQADDPNRLLLSASRYPGIDVALAAEQITARRQICDKLPSWYANPGLVFPARIAAEQASSEITARYKQRFIREGSHVCDLTGGLGIDSSFFARKAARVTYIERNPQYCEAARHNFQQLGIYNINVCEGDGIALCETIPCVDAFYIDPARRAGGNRRVFALRDCEPDLTALLPRLMERAPVVIAKLSPMADIHETLSLLRADAEVHAVAVKNEVKELLFVFGKGATVIHCYNYISEQEESLFTFRPEEERAAAAPVANRVGAYLYEPNAALLKAGAFKTICRLGVEKLHINSHLYTSGSPVKDFPGRTFTVEEVLPFNNRLMKTISRTIPKANITTRNFPLSVAELRKKSNIREGGDSFLFATTLHNNGKTLILCRKYPN